MRPLYFLIGALIFIAGLVFTFVSIFKPGDSPTTVTSAVVLADHAAEANSVSYTMDGVINSAEQHRAVKITVSNSTRTIEIFSGYQGSVISSKSYANSPSSYKEFLAALQGVGFIKQTPKITDTYLGKCPFGYRYVFNTSSISGAPEMLWTTSCGKVKGTFGGVLDSVTQLFKKQIPDYDALLKGVSLK